MKVQKTRLKRKYCQNYVYSRSKNVSEIPSISSECNTEVTSSPDGHIGTILVRTAAAASGTRLDPSLSPRWHQTHPGDGSRVATRGAGPQGHGAAAMAGCRTALSPGGKDTELLARQRDGKGTASSLLEESCPKADSISSGFQLMLLRLWPLSVPKHPNSEESRKHENKDSWFGLEGTLKTIQFQYPPVMSRDTSLELFQPVLDLLGHPLLLSSTGSLSNGVHGISYFWKT